MTRTPIELVAHTATARTNLLLELNKQLRRERERLVGIAVDRLVAHPQVWRDLSSTIESSAAHPIPPTISRFAGLELHSNRFMSDRLVVLFSGDAVVGVIKLGEPAESAPPTSAPET